MNPATLRLQGATRSGRAALLMLCAVALFLTGCDPVVVCDGGPSGQDADNCLGFRLGGTPVIDGIPDEEAWTNSFRYVIGDGDIGNPVPHAITQGMRTSDALFLSFEVNNDTTFDLDDAIVLAFDPDGSAANHRRIHIYPVFPGGAGGGGVPQSLQYWKDSANPTPWTDPGRAPDPTPAWLSSGVRVSSTDSGSSKHWRVEIEIPIVAGPGDPGINLPDDDDFGFYFSVILAETGAVNSALEKSWPIGNTVGDFIEVTPAPASWGNGIFGQRTNGVSIAQLGTDQVPDHHIDVDLPNEFYADIENRMTDAGGVALPANDVRVTFGLLNFGIPNTTPFEPIPVGNNPTPLADVPAGNPGTVQVQTSGWIVPPDLRDDYLANPNQCLKGTLTAEGPNVLIVNREARRNTKFVDTSSPFEERAVVNMRGAQPTPGTRQVELFLREFRYNTDKAAPWTTELAGAVPLGPRLWRLLAQPGPDAPLQTVITPPEITIPVERVAVPPGRPGQTQRVRVTPGHIITLVAEGSVRRGNLEIGPNGTDPRIGGDRRRTATTEPADAAPGAAAPAYEEEERDYGEGGEGGEGGSDEGFPLPPSDSPSRRVGALVGSFDGFTQSAFVVGRASTVMVPAGATELSLGTNDTEEGWREQSGEGYRVEVIQTPADDIYRFTTSFLPREPPRTVLRLNLGQNLPTWMLCGQRNTGQTLTINGRPYRRVADAGCYSYVVKSIGRGQPPPDVTGGPQAGTPGAAPAPDTTPQQPATTAPPRPQERR